MHAYAAKAKDEPRALFWVPVACFAIAGAAFGVLYLLSKTFVPESWQPWIAPPGLVALYQIAYRTLWNRWIWRLKPVQAWVGLPDVQGTWSGRVIPSKASGIAPGEAVLVIEQRWLALRVHFVARLDGPQGTKREAISNSKMAAFVEDGGDVDLRYEYDVTAGAAVNRHQGVAHLRLVGDTLRPIIATGTYYTDREGDPQHWGELVDFKQISRQLLTPESVFGP